MLPATKRTSMRELSKRCTGPSRQGCTAEMWVTWPRQKSRKPSSLYLQNTSNTPINLLCHHGAASRAGTQPSTATEKQGGWKLDLVWVTAAVDTREEDQMEYRRRVRLCVATPTAVLTSELDGWCWASASGLGLAPGSRHREPTTVVNLPLLYRARRRWETRRERERLAMW